MEPQPVKKFKEDPSDNDANETNQEEDVNNKITKTITLQYDELREIFKFLSGKELSYAACVCK